MDQNEKPSNWPSASAHKIAPTTTVVLGSVILPSASENGYHPSNPVFAHRMNFSWRQWQEGIYCFHYARPTAGTSRQYQLIAIITVYNFTKVCQNFLLRVELTVSLILRTLTRIVTSRTLEIICIAVCGHVLPYIIQHFLPGMRNCSFGTLADTLFYCRFQFPHRCKMQSNLNSEIDYFIITIQIGFFIHGKKTKRARHSKLPYKLDALIKHFLATVHCVLAKREARAVRISPTPASSMAEPRNQAHILQLLPVKYHPPRD